ncbi:MAG: ABC transporter permease subunit [Desulforegulaceae bacterium]|nr:ABC transporter permease subunit [Desulforegulaceae bacterium]
MKIKLFKLFSYLSFFIYSSVLVSFICWLLIKAESPFSKSSIFGNADLVKAILLKEPVFEGLFPAAAGTFLIIVTSMIIAIPAGTGTGIFLSEYANKKTYRFLSVSTDILAGLPSIVTGLFGFSIILLIHKIFEGKGPGFSIAASAFSLSFLVLPYIAKSTEEAMKSTDKELRLTALLLGASKTENIRLVLIPKNLSQILSKILLSVARCAEDTSVIMLTGAVANAGIPGNIFGKYEALPFFIYYTSSQYSSEKELVMAYNASVLLVSICCFLFVLSFLIRKAVFYRQKKNENKN